MRRAIWLGAALVALGSAPVGWAVVDRLEPAVPRALGGRQKGRFRTILEGNDGETKGRRSVAEFETIPIPLPSTKAEQEAIAEALTDADALIESLEQLLVKKGHIKQGAIASADKDSRVVLGPKLAWRQ